MLSLSLFPRDHKICSVLVSVSYSKRNIIKSEGSKCSVSHAHLLYEVGLVLFAGKEGTFLSLPPLQPPPLLSLGDLDSSAHGICYQDDCGPSPGGNHPNKCPEGFRVAKKGLTPTLQYSAHPRSAPTHFSLSLFLLYPKVLIFE